MADCTASASALATTGTPVTMYCAPCCGANGRAAVACSIRSIARRFSRVAEVRPQPHLDQRRVLRREQVREARLRHPRLRGEHERGDEARVVEARHVGDPVAQRQRDERLRGLRAGRRRWRPWPAAPAPPADRRARPTPCALPPPPAAAASRGRQPAAQLVLDLVDRGVDERARPVDGLRRLAASRSPRRPAGSRSTGSLRLARSRRRSAFGVPLPPRQPSRLSSRPRSSLSTVSREVALHEHEHRVVAEVLLEALGRLEAVRGAIDERRGRRARLQPQRQGRAAERKHRHDREHEQRPPRHPPGDPPEEHRR